MGNQEHLTLLRQGVEVWNQWRDRNRHIKPDLSRFNLQNMILTGSKLNNADLTESILQGCILKKADCSGAYFIGANLKNAQLQGIHLSNAKLSDADLSSSNLDDAELDDANFSGALLINTSLKRVNFRKSTLERADFQNADLVDAKLVEADLKFAKFMNADLCRANLSQAMVLGTDLTSAILTGACIEDWNINHTTNLKEVKCDFIYLKFGLRGGIHPYFKERRPSSGNFGPGDFTKLFQKSLETIDLIFQNPDWEAFAYSFRKIQVENDGKELEIQSIENKGDGVVIVRVSVSPNADKENLHSSFMRGYEFAHDFLEARYRSELDIKSGEIERQKGYINTLFLLLSQHIGVQMAMAENQKIQQTFNITGPITGFAGNVEGDQHNYAPEQRQNLAEAAAEIQQLIYQLAQKNATSDEAIAEAIHQEIRRNPTLRARLIGALKAGGLEALKAIFNHPLFSIPAETVKGWLEAE